MDKIKRILIESPDITEINLENSDLTSLDELMPDLVKLEQLKSLKLGNNLLTKLPSNMSGLEKLTTLDLRNNRFMDLSAITSGLFSLPNLKHLFVNMSEQEEDEIIISLTNLESFNGTPLSVIPDNDYPTKFEESIEKEEKVYKLEKEEIIEYTGINEGSIEQGSENTNEIDEQDDLKSLFFRIGRLTKNRNEVELEKIWSDWWKSSEGSLSDSLETQRGLMRSILSEFLENIKAKQPSIYPIIRSAFSIYDSLLDSYYKNTLQLTNEYSIKIKTLQKHLDQSDHEISQLLEAAETLEKEALENEEAKKKLAEQLESEKEKLVDEVGYLRAELEKYKNRLRQFHINRQKISTQIGTSPKQILNSSSKSLNTSDTSLSKHVTKANKVLSLKQLKEVIDEIYASKTKFDQKCAENQLPRETMEQHLYTYLNQKYGLKSLILEHATAIIQAIKKFASEDNKVAVFRKIVRNEIDEDFRFVQKQLCDTVAELLKVYLKAKYPKKIDSEINSILQKKMGNDGLLNEEEWVEIVKYMYNKEDSVNVIVKVQEAINKINKRRQKAKKELLKDNRIPYKDFLKVLLDFQLRGHERYLAKFVKLFRQFDTDRNGVLNTIEFRRLFHAINPERIEGDIDYWLSQIDPWNNQQITFSECVAFFSADLVKMMQTSKKEEELSENEELDSDEDESEEEPSDSKEESSFTGEEC
jgi:hypothetical protein